MRWLDAKKWRQRIEESEWLRGLVRWARRTPFPGSGGVSLYDVGWFVASELQRQSLNMRANAIAFSFFLALFPALIFSIHLAMWLPYYESLIAGMDAYIDQIMPTAAGAQLKKFIHSISRPSGSAFSMGLLLTLYFASNGMLALMEGFEKSYLQTTFKKRRGWKKQLIAIGLTIEMGLLLFLSVLFIVLGSQLLELLTGWFRLSALSGQMLNAFRWLTIVVLIYSGIALIFRFGVPVVRPFDWLMPGTLVATLLVVLSSLAFSAYVDAFDTYNKLYGSIGAIIVLMLWIKFNVLFLLTGFELNAAIAVNRDLLAMEEE